VKGIIYVLCLGAAIALVASGCGGSDSSSEGGGSGAEQVANSEPADIAVVSASNAGNLGLVLVNSEGRTLYVFQNDKHTLYSAESSACYGACEKNWPPLLTGGEPEAENGAFPTKLSTLKRKNGTLQVTYYGHPLYTYVGDKKPGEANGSDVKAFGGRWYALQPGGEEPRG
jgi:predicted lipoprotein with Yx(FWY)xxD motif